MIALLNFRISKFKFKIWIWFSLNTSWLPYSTLGFQSSNLRFEFDFRFAVVHCPKQLCRYLREKISQQKIQISTITKGVPITKIEVPINKIRTIWVKISGLGPQTQAAKVIIISQGARGEEEQHTISRQRAHRKVSNWMKRHTNYGHAIKW